MAGLLLAAILATLAVTVLAAVIAVRDHRPLLWRRVLVLLAAEYAAGVVLGAWPVDVVLEPAYAVADRLFVRG